MSASLNLSPDTLEAKSLEYRSFDAKVISASGVPLAIDVP